MKLPFLMLLALVACVDNAPKTTDVDSAEPVAVDEDGDGFLPSEGDCDDDNAAMYPEAAELCDGLDNDCDGDVDEGVGTTYYVDADGDGFGDPAQGEGYCEPPLGLTTVAGDCDDTNPDFHPNAEEPCTENVDYDCDGVVAYADDDADGFAACEDCDDLDATVNPDATEVCNGLDDDCDGVADPASAFDVVPFYADGDSDGFGDPAVSAEACAAPPGYVADTTDCDDTRSDVNPDAPELCDAADTDEDCDGLIDDADPSVDASTFTAWYRDTDGDGYGPDASSVMQCDAPAGAVAAGGDCNDGDTDYHPGAPEADCSDPNDYNCDGSVAYTDADGDHWAACVECDDADAAINPGAIELCDGLDNDCDGLTDPDTATDAGTWYADADGDTYGDPSVLAVSCSAPAGYLADATDCDDTDPMVNPAGVELCNGTDDDCDGVVDPPTSVDALTWYADSDGDTFGDASAPTPACSQPSGFVADDTDCDDTAAAVFPGAVEVCNGIDDDCDAVIDPPSAYDALTWYADTDGDAYGDAASTTVDCSAPAGFVGDATDCDDTRSDVNPGAAELCDSLYTDENCNGLADDDDPTLEASSETTWYGDLDTDGYGDPASGFTGCLQPSGYILDGTDCDDSRSGVHPGADEYCDALDVDEDCDGLADDDDPTVDPLTYDTFYEDHDGDGYGGTSSIDACDLPPAYAAADGDCDDTDPSISPGATEVCDGVDNNCDGTIDEGCATSCFIDFEDAYTARGAGANPTLHYGAYGLTFTMGSGYGLIGGDSHGDPGNWSDVWTVPDAAWGMWDFGSSVNTLAFSTDVTNVTFDLARTAGASDITVRIDSYLSGALVASSSVRLVGASSIQSISLAGTIDEIRTQITSSGYAYAIDNLEYDTPGTCPP